ncbi:MAG: UDP-N-acetylmuramate dehydrogenase [Deltaproteobacteria bacterium]|nr:UDP-N-acetylmuramate dehydrogenase [Deltaproteobacteria bacterium]
MKDTQKAWLKETFGPLVNFHEPMSRHTTFRIGGPATVVTVRDERWLRTLVRWASDGDLALLILGAGSNLLVADAGIKALVVKLAGDFEKIELAEAPDVQDTMINAGAAAMVRALGRYALSRALAGLNFTLGIPGSVGGALRMNAGAWGGCMADVIHAVTVLKPDGDMVTTGRKHLDFTYRSMRLEKGDIIVGGQFRVQPGDREALRKEATAMQKKRAASQPLSEPSAGCVFRNPGGTLTAGELIDKAGLKGLRRGDAQVSSKHANFIINHGCATAADVMGLIETVQETVFKRFGVALEPEVTIVE